MINCVLLNKHPFMLQKIYILSAILFLQTLFSQKTEPIYYDPDWKVTTKDKALYYRQTPIKELGEMILLQDFYINGNPQFEGYTFKNDENKYVGDIVWYDENGHDTTFRIYPNSTKESTLTYYYPNGKVRKTIQYKKGLKDTETVYHQDGSILMKGIFENGKPFSGDFDNIKNINAYEDIEDEEQATTTAVLAPLPPKIQETKGVEIRSQSDSKSKGKKVTVTEKIFWANSKQIAQETLYEMGSYDFSAVQQKNYDQNGKLLQNLTSNHFEDYGNRVKNGTEYSYYLQNNFATSLRAITPMIEGDKSGKAISYFPNGKKETETLYVKGSKEGEEIVHSENGTVKNKRIYKENSPFMGNFDVIVGEISINLNYLNGEKDGEAIAKNEENEIIAKGIYKNGKPFSGTFVINNENDDLLSLINVENFKKTGLQKDFNYRLSSLVKTYTLQNGKLNGKTTFYSQDKPVATLEYKNDQPFEGTLIDGNTVSQFKNGNKIQETTYNQEFNQKSDDQISNQKIFENGILVKIRNSTFQITEKPQSIYEGIYKNEKPFSGYFETEDDREFKQVDYYENGEKKFQYSNDYLKNMDNYRFQTYDIKSTYKDGKIVDGVNYQLRDRQYISGYYKNGMLQSFNWDLFAVHYFNRISFKLKGNTIEMTELQEGKKGSIVIETSKDRLTKKLLMEGKLVDTKTYSGDKTKNASIILYTIEDEKLVSKTMETLDTQIDVSGESELMYKVYISINEKSGNIQEIFNHLAKNIGSEEWMEGEVSREILTGLRTDASGTPQEGILITENKDKTFSLQSYEKGKIEKQAQNIPFKNLEKEVKKLENNH